MQVSILQLGDIAEVIAGQSPSGENYNGDGEGLPFYQGKKEFNDKYIGEPKVWTRKTTKVALQNDILMSVRAPVGPINVATEECCIGRGLAAIRAKSGKTTPEYLYYFLLSIQRKLVGKEGTVFDSISRDQIAAIRVPVPPLDVQSQIVARLDEAFVQIEALQTVYDSEEKQAVALSAALITEQLKKVEAEFGTLGIADIFEIGRGGSPRPIKDYLTTAEDGINWIKIGDATRTGKYITDTKQKIKPAGVSRSRRVYSGELLLSNSMSFGRPYILRTDGCIHDGWVVLTPKTEVDLEYAYYALGSKFLYNQFSRLAQGSTVQNLNIDLISGAKLPLPPIEMQRDLAIKFKGLEDGAAALQGTKIKSLEKVLELRASWLASEFKGGNVVSE
jgi:type I restriction enzyme S subunit